MYAKTITGKRGALQEVSILEFMNNNHEFLVLTLKKKQSCGSLEKATGFCLKIE